ncbi:MAG: hypothetical protein Q9222_006844 [Ikaeria aurantiellina]
MDKVKGVAKGGWHPKGKDGGRESWRGDNKGINQVAGWVGKGKSPVDKANEHVSRPLTTLKDPGSFGPPPKNVNYHGGAAVPNAITPDRRGLGAPMSTGEIRAKEEAEQREAREAEEAAAKPAPPPVPYKVNTSGLSTSNLPKPPIRRFDQVDQSPASPVKPITKPKPLLPPRLPPRQGSTPQQTSSSPPPPYSAVPDNVTNQDSQINAGAAGRLASAGVSVPGFGIGRGSQNTQETDTVSTSPTGQQGSGANSAQLSELHSRFSKLSTQRQGSESPSEGTSMADKEAAVRTAQSFHNDPSSVSLSDARATAATANNFRERHGDQVSAGWKSANAFNKKHDIGGRLKSYGSREEGVSQTEAQQSPVASPSSSMPLHKRAPPPPPQKPSFGGGSSTSPPPVPLSSKPKS